MPKITLLIQTNLKLQTLLEKLIFLFTRPVGDGLQAMTYGFDGFAGRTGDSPRTKSSTVSALVNGTPTLAIGFGVSPAKSTLFVLVSALLTAIYLLLHSTAGYAPRGGWVMVPELLALLVIYGSVGFGASALLRCRGHGVGGH